MGTLRFYLLLFVLSCATPVFTQEEGAIRWSPELQLQWSDFKGKPDDKLPVAALTASGISYSFSYVESSAGEELTFEVDTFFYPAQSWYRPAVCDEIILSHEQLHFDIAELFARKFRKALSDTSFGKDVKSEIQRLYKKTIRELRDFQKLYDEETNFSRNREAQLRRNREVRKALDATPLKYHK